MTKQETVPIESGRCYAMETNVETTKVMRISTQPSPLQFMVHQKQLKNVEYFNYLGSVITNDARCTREIVVNPGLPSPKQHSTGRRLYSLTNGGGDIFRTCLDSPGAYPASYTVDTG